MTNGNVLDTATDCGLDCYGQADPEACSQSCVANGTGLSWSCSGCVAGVVQCTIDHCLGDCLSPESTACSSCQEQWCIPPFLNCSGLALPDGF